MSRCCVAGPARRGRRGWCAAAADRASSRTGRGGPPRGGRGEGRTRQGSAGLVRRRGRPRKLSDRQVSQARVWSGQGQTQQVIADRLGVAQSVISDLLARLAPVPVQEPLPATDATEPADGTVPPGAVGAPPGAAPPPGGGGEGIGGGGGAGGQRAGGHAA